MDDIYELKKEANKAIASAYGVPEKFIRVSAHKHTVGNGYKAFPNGIWYGTIDGRQVTLPCTSFDLAIRLARLVFEKDYQ